MQIKLFEPIDSDYKKLYLNQETRYPTVTDIQFINDDLIIVAHRHASKIFLIKINPPHYEILDTLIITLNGKPHQTEALQVLKNKIYLICYSEYLFIIDICEKLKITDIIKVNNNKTPYHGIKKMNEFIYLTPSRKSEVCEPIIQFNTINKTYFSLPIGDIKKKYRIKDILFINEKLVVLPIIYKTKTFISDSQHKSNGMIGLFSFPDFKLLDTKEFQNIHFDLGTNFNNKFIICTQDQDGGFLYTGEVNNNKIGGIKKISVAGFPHGVAIHNNLLAYTSYETSSVYILSLII
jgi:hypothetical protein